MSVIVEGEQRQRYLGDGVYASFDGYHIWLRTDRENGTHEIALEPPVFEALRIYADLLRQPATPQNGEHNE